MDGYAPRTVGVIWVCSVVAAVALGLLLPGGDNFLELITTAFALVPLTAGRVIARALPGRPEGPVTASAGLIQIVVVLLPTNADSPWSGDWMLLYLPLAVLLLLVPEGHPGGAPWTVVLWSLVVVAVLFIVLAVLLWLYNDSSPILVPLGLVLVGIYFVLLLLTLFRVVMRFRSADSSGRSVLRWVYMGATTLPLTLLLCWTSYLLSGNEDLVVFGLATMYVAIPLAVAIALVRPEGFDVQWAFAGLLAFGILAVLLVGVGTLTLLWQSTRSVQLSQGTVLACGALGAALAAGCYPTLRRRVDSVLFPLRARAVKELAQLAIGVDRGSRAPEELQQVLRRSLRDPELSVRIYPAATGKTAVLQVPNRMASEVWVRGERMAVIVSGPEAVHPVPPVVVGLAAPLIASIRLRAQLHEATIQLHASKERILRAGEMERRRIERDLHDGVQQRLVALGLQLRLLQRESIPPRAVQQLDVLVGEVTGAVADLRDITHGASPGILERGLAVSLEELCRFVTPKPELNLDLNCEPEPEIARVIYFVASEALTNALRHASARKITLSLTEDDDGLSIQISDDGVGTARFKTGGGLDGLAQRVETIGGRLQVRSVERFGSVVRADIPCAS